MKPKRATVVGSTGLIGSNLVHVLEKQEVDVEQINSQTAQEDFLRMGSDSLFIAAPSAVKWQANANPAGDSASIERLIGNLALLHPQEAILFSTVDVYKNKEGCDESETSFENLEPYGKNRRYFELACSTLFQNLKIIRLPALIGPGLKKNVLFDLVHKKNLGSINTDSEYQWFDLSNLFPAIEIIRSNQVSTINFISEPIKVSQMIQVVFPEMLNEENLFDSSNSASSIYDCKSLFANYWRPENTTYMFTKKEIFLSMKKYKLENSHNA